MCKGSGLSGRRRRVWIVLISLRDLTEKDKNCNKWRFWALKNNVFVLFLYLYAIAKKGEGDSIDRMRNER